MEASLLRTNKEISEIYNKHVDMVFRICFMYVKNEHDTMDMVQNTFLKLVQSSKQLDSLEHEKAWLIVTASNNCKDFLKNKSRKNLCIDQACEISVETSFEIDETIISVLKLPDKIKQAIYLYYYEGYTTPDIAKLMNKTESTIRGYLHKGRNMLKLELGGNIS